MAQPGTQTPSSSKSGYGSLLSPASKRRTNRSSPTKATSNTSSREASTRSSACADAKVVCDAVKALEALWSGRIQNMILIDPSNAASKWEQSFFAHGSLSVAPVTLKSASLEKAVKVACNLEACAVGYLGRMNKNEDSADVMRMLSLLTENRISINTVIVSAKCEESTTHKVTLRAMHKDLLDRADALDAKNMVAKLAAHKDAISRLLRTFVPQYFVTSKPVSEVLGDLDRQSARHIVDVMKSYDISPRVAASSESSEDEAAASAKTKSSAAVAKGRHGKGSSVRKPCLVLDMDETLIHTQFNASGTHTVLHRPGLADFLASMDEVFELIVFTAGSARYAEAVMNAIDPNRHVKKRLSREHCSPTPDGVYCKDLRKIPDVDMARTIIIDNIPENYDLQPDNGIPIIDFVGDPHDDAFKVLTPMLLQFAADSSLDARTFLSKNMKRVGSALHAGYY